MEDNKTKSNHLFPSYLHFIRSDGYWSVSKVLVRYFKSIDKALFLSELVAKENYFKQCDKLRDGKWFFLTYDKIKESTFISVKKQRTYVKEFRDKYNLISTKKMGYPSMQYYCINEKGFNQLLIDIDKENNLYSPPQKGRTRPTQKGRSIYNNKEDNNNSFTFNKLKDKSKVSEKKPTSQLKDPVSIKKYHKKVHCLFNKWQDLNIVKHRENSKPYLKALSKLNIYWRNRKQYGYKKIEQAFDVYQRLLNEILKNKYPYKVGLDEFFGFSNDIEKKQIWKKHKDIKDVIDTSWFNECLKGYDYVSSKYMDSSRTVSKDHYPKITKAFKIHWEKYIGEDKCDSVMKENTFRKASVVFMDFYDDNKKRFLYEEERERPVSLIGKVVSVIDEMKNRGKKVHPGWLTKRYFYDNEFEEYLTGMDLV